MFFTLINILIMIILLAFFELYIETRFHIRKKIVSKLGAILTMVLAIVAVLLIDAAVGYLSPDARNHELFKFATICFIVFFLPKKGDKIWKER